MPRFHPPPMLLPLAAALVLVACSNPEANLPLAPVVREDTPVNQTPDRATPDPATEALTTRPTPESEAKRVLLVINTASPDSREVGAYYRAKRKIPSENIVLISTSTTENIDPPEFETGILKPIRENLRFNKNNIDFVVLTMGIPIRLKDNNGYSVDGHIAALDLPIKPITELTPEGIRQAQNPYFGATVPFSRERFRMLLVTRLIGYTVEDAKRLVDNSLAATPAEGPFFFDLAGNRNDGGYARMQEFMRRAHANLTARGKDSRLDETTQFILPDSPVMGYASWGSNDGAFNIETYRNIRFRPGAIAETFVSTSARTFKPTTGGQSLVADLIASGITGVKGYVSEPYTFALAQPDILFDRYTRGFNLAEAFYAASPVLKWKDLVVGDPLCRPFPPN